LTIASAVLGYLVVADWIVRPLHERGAQWGGTLACLDGVSAILEFPGLYAVQLLGLRNGHHTTTGVWFGIVLITFLFCAAGARVAFWAMAGPARRMAAGRDPSADPAAGAAEPADRAPLAPSPPACGRADDAAVKPSYAHLTSRRKFLVHAARAAAGGAAAVGAYSFLVETHWLGVSRHKYVLRDLPPELDGLRVVQLTDVHHGPTLTLDYVRRVVRTTNALKPDLVLLTGDYVYRSPEYIEPVVRELSLLHGTVGVVGVMGNHDWWEDPIRTRRAFAAAGIPLIDNDRLFVTPERKLVRSSGEGLCVAGVGDYMEDVIRPDQALSQVPAAMPRLLLSHNPDAAEDPALVRPRPRVDLMICGHTHGGQIWVPGLGTPIIPSRYGQKYRSGFVAGPACPVFVSRGIGTTVLPLRFCVPPEIVAFELRCG
jgi:predicted MPP superfamily phosphohydrolase